MTKKKRFQEIIDRIKELSAEQKVLKPERKTVHFKGVRKYQNASRMHHNNRFELRHLHMVYDSLRGRVVAMPKKAYYHEATFEKMVTKYTPKEALENVA